MTYTPILAAELARTGELEAVSRDDISALVGLSRTKQQIGCADQACLSEIGGMLDAKYMVSGSISAVGKLVVLSARMIDARRARVLNRVVKRYTSTEELVKSVDELARELLAEAAVLHLYNQVPGATVFVDDKFIGTMPLEPTPMQSAGTVRIRVESPDYLPWETDAVLTAGRTTRLRADLESLEGLADADLKLYMGLGAAGLAAVLGGVSALLFIEGADIEQTYRDTNPTDTTQAQLDDLASRPRSRYAGGYAVAAIGAFALAGAAWLLVDSRADAARLDAGPGALTAGGAFGAWTVRF